MSIAPIDMVLHCPACHLQHIDAPSNPSYRDATGELVLPTGHWDNPPHRSHLCHGCGLIWRPADVPTNGVAAVKTKGKADSVHLSTTPLTGSSTNTTQALADSWDVRRRVGAVPLPVRYEPIGGCTCAGPDGPCAACIANEEAYNEWLTEPSISPREAADHALECVRAALANDPGGTAQRRGEKERQLGGFL